MITSFRVLSAFRRYLGIDPKILLGTFRGLPYYLRDLREIKKQKGEDDTFILGPKNAMLSDRFTESGSMSGHYFHTDLHVAKKIFKDNPKRHVDIGSRTDGFVAHIATFREIEVLDIRDQKSKVANILFRQADLMQLPDGMVNYCDSISALHSIEHFGLGRYGDPIDYFGHLRALENIYKMLQPGGKFYFAVPIGKQRIEFNAHRVFSVDYLMDIFKNGYEINQFAYVDDKGELIENVQLTPADAKTSFNCVYGCGIFELTKR